MVALHHHAHRALAQWQGANQRSYELAVRTIDVGLRYMEAAWQYDANYWEDAVGVGRDILPLAEQWPESLMLKEASICNDLGGLL
ncbi:MAG: hypothetical protein IPL28_26095, partial [Chloroflexi bacterium]|nr:hypothetical protein [Chloroflexota bacterium]